jgi:hypothetical protein
MVFRPDVTKGVAARCSEEGTETREWSARRMSEDLAVFAAAMAAKRSDAQC